MVLGTPTMLMPMPCNLVATPRVSSPPMATIAPRLSDLMFFTTCSAPPSFLKGLVRLVPRMVPPRWRMPLVASRVSRSCWGGSSKPRQPSRMPITSRPSCSPRRTTARITALRPGQSPPPVRTAIFMSEGSTTPQSGMQPPSGDHFHWAEEEVLLAVVLPAAGRAGGPIQPLPRDHLPVVGQSAEKRRIRFAQVAAHQRAEQRLEAPLGKVRVAPRRVELAVEPRRDVE